MTGYPITILSLTTENRTKCIPLTKAWTSVVALTRHFCVEDEVLAFLRVANIPDDSQDDARVVRSRVLSQVGLALALAGGGELLVSSREVNKC